MTTIGDSFSIVALLLGIGFTTWAMIIFASLIFSKKTKLAQEFYEQSPWRGFFAGVVILMTEGFVSFILLSQASPPLKILGAIGLFLPLAISAIGTAGLCKLVATRIKSQDPSMSEYAALNRATMLMAAAWFFPLLGWLFIAPLMVVTSLGIGWLAISRKKQVHPLAEVA